MFMFAFTTLFSLFLSSLVGALPTSRDIINPPILIPNASTVWHSGETVTVTWDTSVIPPPSQVTDKFGEVVLGYLNYTSDSEHLMIDSPLAIGFPLTDGNVSFVVPSVPTRHDYIVDLFGDSGNISPRFTIIGTHHN